MRTKLAKALVYWKRRLAATVQALVSGCGRRGSRHRVRIEPSERWVVQRTWWSVDARSIQHRIVEMRV